ncbi:MAG: DUF1207 domain-containing protein [Candidatus Anammoximicrobium sp.]|nr:DUF1207 domain-containing protein [Candidatus Anammoximicrobium sp.]
MRFAKPTRSPVVALWLALIAGPFWPVAAAGTEPSDGAIAPAVESFGSLIEGELGTPPSFESRSSLPLIALQSAAESELGVPLYEQDLQRPEIGFFLLPQGLIYRSYLGGPKESRMAAGIVNIPDDSTLWDATIGGRLGMFRIGNSDPIRPRGFQVDVEAAAMVRLDIPEDVDVRGTDYRVGVPVTWGNEFSQWKFAYYHMSSHLGDEYWEDHLGFPLFRQARDALVLGHSLYLTDSLRLYAEVGWAFYCVASEPWEVQFGLDYAPRVATGLRGAPFFAINGYLREELDFGGGLNVQAGWAWRADATAHLMRLGFQYYNGASTQYAFLPFHETQYGLVLWYDF